MVRDGRLGLFWLSGSAQMHQNVSTIGLMSPLRQAFQLFNIRAPASQIADILALFWQISAIYGFLLASHKLLAKFWHGYGWPGRQWIGAFLWKAKKTKIWLKYGLFMASHNTLKRADCEWMSYGQVMACVRLIWTSGGERDSNVLHWCAYGNPKDCQNQLSRETRACLTSVSPAPVCVRLQFMQVSAVDTFLY